MLAVTGGTQSSLSTGGSTSKSAGTGGSVSAGGSGAKNTGGSNTTSSTGGANPGTGGSTQVGSFEAISTAASCRKVKNLLVGLACTDADIATLNQSGIAGLKTLVNTWITSRIVSAYPPRISCSGRSNTAHVIFRSRRRSIQAAQIT